MKREELLTFINGEFSVEDAREILLNVLITKVNYNKLKNISSHERYGKEDPMALARIRDLNESIERFKALLLEAQENNSSLTIFSDIKVGLSEN